MRKHRNEDLVQAACRIQDQSCRAYRLHQEDRPIMEFDVVEGRIYAYPYAGYRNRLSETSEKLLDREYRDAEANRQIGLGECQAVPTEVDRVAKWHRAHVVLVLADIATPLRT